MAVGDSTAILFGGIVEGLLQVFEVVTVLWHLEAGAGLVDAFEFTVAHNRGIGVVHLQGA